MKARLDVSCSAVALALVMCSTDVSAQTTVSQASQTEDAAVDPPVSTSEEIVVTARRREERLQDTPVAVTALGGAALEQRSITNLQDIAQFVPTMVSARGGTGGAAGQYFLRGIGQGDYTVNLDPGVALYIDGVYFARTQGANLELADLDRVEVLRGPQGTLYGKNSTGGLINYLTRLPDAPERATGLVGVSSRNGLRGQFAFNRALVDDTLYIGGSLVASRIDGYRTSRIAPENATKLGLPAGRFGDRSMVAGRVSLLYRPSSAVSFLLRGDLSDQTGTAQPLALVAIRPGGVTDLLLTPEQRANINNYDANYSGYRAPDDLRSGGVSLTATFDIGDVQLKSITAYRELRQNTGQDFDATQFAIADQRQLLDQNQWSEELQLSGALFGDRLNWITGLYYLREDLAQQLTIDGRAAPNTISGGTVQYQRIGLDNESFGAFVNLDLELFRNLNVNAAVRYTDETKTITRLTQRFANLNLVPPLATLQNRKDKDSWSQWTPKFGVDYKPAEDVLLYATYSRGFRSGGFNIRPAPASSDSFQPETVDAIEVGAKTELLDKRVRLNVAAFSNNYKDIQLLVREGTSIFTFNGGRAITRGFEFELDARATENLKFNLAGGYLDTEIKEVLPGSILVGIRPGNRLGYAPEWTFSGGAEYRVPLSNESELRFRADASYRSDLFYSATNNIFDYTNGYTLVNGRISYDRGSVTISGFVTNLLDKEYWLLTGDNTGSPNTGYAYGVPAEPRRWGLELSYAF